MLAGHKQLAFSWQDTEYTGQFPLYLISSFSASRLPGPTFSYTQQGQSAKVNFKLNVTSYRFLCSCHLLSSLKISYLLLKPECQLASPLASKMLSKMLWWWSVIRGERQVGCILLPQIQGNSLKSAQASHVPSRRRGFLVFKLKYQVKSFQDV